MRRVIIGNRSKDNLLHVEAPGCIVNIRVGLETTDGHPVTSVEILADSYAGTGNQWTLPDHGDARALNVRVVRRLARGEV